VVNGGFDVTNTDPSTTPFDLGSNGAAYIASTGFGSDQAFQYGNGASGPSSGDIAGWVGTDLTGNGFVQDAELGSNYVGAGTSTGFYTAFEKESVSQTLSSNLEANSIYTLNFAAADRIDQFNPGNQFTVQLFAGSTPLTQVISTGPDVLSTSDSPTLTSTFQNFTFTYDSSLNSSVVGQPLEIVFSSLEPSDGGSHQVLVDNVSLDVTGPSTPEPSTYALMLAGIGMLALGARLRRQNV
jgi:hypothetical protein